MTYYVTAITYLFIVKIKNKKKRNIKSRINKKKEKC